MKVLSGIPVSDGVAIGTAIVLDAEGHRIPLRHISPDQVEAESNRLREALAAAAKEARESQQAISDKIGRPIGDILGAHAQLLEGGHVAREADLRIRSSFIPPSMP